jgi:60 kDa SS-A/Ro ribonucleoprotein
LKYVVHDEVDADHNPKLIVAYEEMKKATTVKEVIGLIKKHNLTWEFVPSQWHGEKSVWTELLPNLPATALVRNLSRLTAYDILKPTSDSTRFVVGKLTEYIDNPKSRLHPGQMLMAWGAYKSGKSPNLNWKPVREITDILEYGFYERFKTVDPTGKSFYIGLDVSGSMDAEISGLPFSARVASSALALQLVRTEKSVYTAAFTGQMLELEFGKFSNLNEVTTKTSNLPFGRTDCAQPMLDALNKKLFVDCFVIITDNETWAGTIHPVKALQQYRDRVNPIAKLVVVGVTATQFSIADPNDIGMLDVVGFDSEVIKLTQTFGGGL